MFAPFRLTRLAALAALVLTTLPSCVGTEPGQGGTLRIAGRDIGNLNPLFASDNSPWELAHLWCSYLFNVDDHGALEPELATAVPTPAKGGISRDGRTIVYNIRRNVLWQDGQSFTARDVIYTWKQILNPKNDAPSRSPYDMVQTIEQRGRFALAVHLRRPFAPFVADFFVNDVCILPEHLLARERDLNHAPYNSAPIGTGPYRVTGFVRGSAVHLAANLRYWRGVPGIKTIDWRMVPDSNTALTELRSHDVDLRTAIAPAQLDPLEHMSALKVYGTQQNARFLSIFNVARPVFADVRVRRALAHATDVRAIVRDVTHDRYSMSDSDQAPYSWAHTNDVVHYRFSLAAAGKLLDDAGWKRGADGVRRKDGEPLAFTLTSIASSTLANEVEVLLQNQWSALGAQVTVKNYSVPFLYGTRQSGGIYANGKFDIAIDATILGADPDDSDYVMCNKAPPNGFNIGRYCDPELDAAERAATEHYDQNTRKAAYVRAQQIVARDVPFIVLWYVKTYDAANVQLKGYNPAQGGVPYWNVWQWRMERG